MSAGNGEAAKRNPFLRGFLTQIANPKVAVFFGSIFVAMLPQEVPLWMVVALVAIVTANEVVWYTLVALFFGSGPVRRFYLAPRRWIDRATGLFLGALAQDPDARWRHRLICANIAPARKLRVIRIAWPGSAKPLLKGGRAVRRGIPMRRRRLPLGHRCLLCAPVLVWPPVLNCQRGKVSCAFTMTGMPTLI